MSYFSTNRFCSVFETIGEKRLEGLLRRRPTSLSAQECAGLLDLAILAGRGLILDMEGVPSRPSVRKEKERSSEVNGNEFTFRSNIL